VGFGTSLAAGDLDGDGHPELAVGAPCNWFVVGGCGEGARDVSVFNGSADGPRRHGGEIWDQANSGIADDAVDINGFGWALAIGDFDGDASDDLAMGAPNAAITDCEIAGQCRTGAVVVIYGSPGGLTADRSQLWHPGVPGVPGDVPTDPFAEDGFGRALAAGDLNGDDVADLAIGAPQSDEYSGSVVVLYGGDEGLGTDGAQRWSLASPGIPGTASGFDGFGSALAVTHAAGSTIPGLAIGAPYHRFGTARGAGIVLMLPGSWDGGSTAGLTATGSQVWSQRSDGIRESPEKDDSYGSSLTP
jgi:hypothetical protein